MSIIPNSLSTGNLIKNDGFVGSTEMWLLLGLSSILVVGLFFILRKRKKRPLAKQPSPEVAPGLEEIPARLPEEAQPQISLPSDVDAILRDDQASWLQRLRSGLDKTRKHLKDNLSRLISEKNKFDEDLLDQIHEVLYRSDMGVETADQIVSVLRRQFIGTANQPSWQDISATMQIAISDAMGGDDPPLNTPSEGPLVILIVGVNGVGKTTTIGKLAARFIAEGKSVLLCAGDTYRAAAIEQLQIWGERLGVPVIKHQQGSDPASVAFDGVQAAKSRGVDVLLIDTAGRLHNKQELMEELAKIRRVISRELPSAPHETWLVIDATTGQNAVQQVQAFKELIQLSGLIVTKLDGTAKGGVVVGIRRKFQLPIRYIGVGEKASDLKEFRAQEYAESILSTQ